MKKTGKRMVSLALSALMLTSNTEPLVWAAEPGMHEGSMEPEFPLQGEPEVSADDSRKEITKTEESAAQEIESEETESEETEETQITEETEPTEEIESEESEKEQDNAPKEVPADQEKDEKTEKKGLTISNPDGKQQKYEFTINAAGYKNVKMALWSDKNGQDDLIWYTASQNGGTYKFNVEIKNHASTGVYIAHIYGTNQNGKTEYIDGARFNIDPPAAGKTEVEKRNTGFQVKLNGVSSPSGIKKVEAGVWCNDNQSDLVWMDAEEKDGVYTLDIDAIQHGITAGIYKVHFYAVDGNGFRNYCGGISQEVKVENNVLILENKDQQQKIYNLTLGTTEYTEVQFGVWSEKNGQDDLKWYTAKRDGNVYRAEISIKDHGSTGIYDVHAYGKKAGKISYIKGTKFTVAPPTEGNFVPTPTDTGFKLNFDGITSPSGITKIEAGVWCSSDQSDLTWQTLKPKNGKYELDVKVADHRNLLGTYIVHVYAVDGNGIRTYCGGVRQNVGITAKSMKADITGTTSEIVLSDVVTYGMDVRIRVALWSQKNGQDDLVWHDAKKNGSNYTVSIPTNQLKDDGSYYAHAYAYTPSGEKTYVSGITFSRNNVVTVGEAEKGQMAVDVSNVDGTKEFTGFSLDVWTKDDKSDLLKVDSVKISDKEHRMLIPLSEFGLFSGNYHIAVYGTPKDGKRKLLREETKEVLLNKGTVTKPVTSDKKFYTVTLNDLDLKGMEKSLEFVVWSEENGQDDLKRYTPTKSGNSYTVEIPIYEHKVTGKYFVHIYAKLQNDRSVFVNGTTFQVDEIKQHSMEIRKLDSVKGSAEIAEWVGYPGYTVTGMRVGIWNADINGEVVWYDMKKSGNEYVATFDFNNHKQQRGKYNAHVYVADESKQYRYLDGASFTISADNKVVYEKKSGQDGKVIIYEPKMNGKPVTAVKMGTWSDAGSQDDLKWIEAKKGSNGSYYVDILRKDYKRTGDFTTHVYGYLDGTWYFLGGARYTVYKTGEFDAAAQEVMHKVIFAVETGGQVYGRAQYDCFSPAYNLSAKETAITIGAAGWFATEAQRLLRLTREEDPELFASLDTEGIGDDVDNANWTTYGSDGNGNATILRGSPKAKCIQALISSEAGIRVQNRLVDQQMIKYVEEAKKLGVEDLKGQMFLANVRHLGGSGPMKWVVECCKEDGLPLTMRNLYTSMRNHTPNKEGNGVGADKYNRRHVKVMEWLDKYVM